MSKQITDFNEAVDYVFDHLYDSAKLEIKHTSKSDLICYHLLLGQVVRNNLILWGNPELLQSADCSHPDKASHKIVVAVWERLQSIDDSEFTEPRPEPIDSNWHASTKKHWQSILRLWERDF